MRQIKLDLNFNQSTPPLQYKLNLPDITLVNDDKKLDFMIRRYQQLISESPVLSCPETKLDERTDLRYLEAGSRYFEIQDFYTKFNILKSVIVPADDVLVVHSDPQATSISRWSNYTVCINWYINNWGTIYQYYDQEQLVDQFRPDDFTLWAMDLEQAHQTINLDYTDKTRTYITWLYKNRTLNQVLADWTHHNK
jgi:hypothetical protein